MRRENKGRKRERESSGTGVEKDTGIKYIARRRLRRGIRVRRGCQRKISVRK